MTKQCDCIDKYSAASLRDGYEAKLKTMQASRDTFREAAARNGRLLARLRVALDAYPDSDLVSLAEYYAKYYQHHAKPDTEADPE